MSRKGENIYKRKDGRWEGRYVKSKSPSGKTQYGYVYAKTYRDAKEKLRKAFASHSQQSIPPTTNITCFSVIASEWLNNTIPQVKESTINKYHNLRDNTVYFTDGVKDTYQMKPYIAPTAMELEHFLSSLN